MGTVVLTSEREGSVCEAFGKGWSAQALAFDYGDAWVDMFTANPWGGHPNWLITIRAASLFSWCVIVVTSLISFWREGR